MEPSGLFYYPGIVPTELSELVLSDLESGEYSHVTGPKSRRVRHYGFEYNYRSGTSKKEIEPIPELYQRLAELVPLDFTPNQVIINEYMPGQGIGAHIDAKYFGPVIACFTFGSGATMEFSRGEDKFELFTEPNSLYVMSGEARAEWKHQMRPRKSDRVDGKKITRGKRISVTYRTV